MKGFPSERDFYYIVGFLVIFIIFIISGRLADNVEVVAYVGFAGTIVSIILAVIAIIYSFYQNSTYANSTQKLDTTANKIVKITNELSEVAEISVNIKELKTTVDTINNIVTSIESNLYDQLNKKPENVSSHNHKFSSQDVNENPDFEYDKKYFEVAVSNLTVLSSVVIVWLQKSHKNNTIFDINECGRFFIESIMMDSFTNSSLMGVKNSINGLLIAYEHLAFFTLRKLSENEFEVTNFDELLEEVIEEGKTQISLLNDHFDKIDEIIVHRKKQ